MYDMTTIKEAERVKAENNLKNKFFAKITHEFKTPINSILGLINRIKNNLENNFDKKLIIKKEINQIEILSNYTIYLINDIIDYSNNKEKIIGLNVKYERLNITDILTFCRDILETLLICKGREKEISIIYQNDILIDNELIIAYSDNFRIKQILLNFISNSVKFTKSGFIKLRSSLRQEENKNNSKNTFLLLSVIDTGIGIQKTDMNLLFDLNIKLNTEDYNNEGSGLGLSICKYVANSLNLDLEVHSDYGKGSEFSIKLICSIKDKIQPKINDFETFKGNILFKNNPTPFFKFSGFSNSTEIIDTHPIILKRDLIDIFYLDNSNKSEICINSKNEIENGFNSDYKSCLTIVDNNHTINTFNTCLKKNKTTINKDERISFNFLNNSSIEKLEINNIIFSDVNFKIKNIKNNNEKDLEKKIIENKMKILIVDDHIFIRESLRNIIYKFLNQINKLDKFEVIEGRDGVDILNYVINDQINKNLIKCIITDENMEYINGSEAIEILRKLEKLKKIKHLPIASITAFEDEFSKKKIKNAGADIIFSKPCSEKILKNFFFETKIFE